MRPLPPPAVFLAALLVLSARPAAGGELVFRLGVDDLGGTETTGSAGVEYRPAPFAAFGRLTLGWGAALEIDADGDAYVAAGPVLLLPLGQPAVVLGGWRPARCRASTPAAAATTSAPRRR